MFCVDWVFIVPSVGLRLFPHAWFYWTASTFLLFFSEGLVTYSRSSFWRLLPSLQGQTDTSHGGEWGRGQEIRARGRLAHRDWVPPGDGGTGRWLWAEEHWDFSDVILLCLAQRSLLLREDSALAMPGACGSDLGLDMVMDTAIPGPVWRPWDLLCPALICDFSPIHPLLCLGCFSASLHPGTQTEVQANGS